MSEMSIGINIFKTKEAADNIEYSGYLRTTERYHMQEVYAKKSLAYKAVKRFFDITLSALALVVLSPVLLVTAIAIKLEDGGSVFYFGSRAGKDMKEFKMWKFRSMHEHADEELGKMMEVNEQTGHAFKIKNDPRITKVGKVIRRLSIDELPQLVNVIKGDMSLVGPRPILYFQMEECDAYDRQRLTVRPGITCYWQVSGRANIDWDRWVELDLDYIENMSARTDLKLLLKTIPAVFSGEGAY